VARHQAKGFFKMTHNPNNTADPTTGQARPPKPIPLTVIPKNIPAELQALNQWLIWRYFWKPDLGYFDKPPLDANKSGNAGKSTDPKTWATFEKALSSYHLGNLDGIGIALTEKNGLVGFDLDGCRNPETGEIAPWALKIVEQVRTYWEISTSGTGLRGVGRGRKPGSRCRAGNFEMYASGRYLCITGHHLEGTPGTIETVQQDIDTANRVTTLFTPVRNEADRVGPP
jgi:primase-polymerase (primpol)-like protein